MATYVANFPPQQLPDAKKTDEWRRRCVDWADFKGSARQTALRKSYKHKVINYDLLEGKLHMEDLVRIVDPNRLKADGVIPDAIQHYPIMLNKMHLLVGEELKRVYDYRVVVTNPEAVSEIERNKKKAVNKRFEEFLQSQQQDRNSDENELDAINEYFTYEWQDMREIRANCLLKHYEKEQGFGMTFSAGFRDAMAVGEEVYQCAIEGGEPVLRKLNPKKLQVYMNGYSNKIDDADVVVYEDYWSVGTVIDRYYDALSEKDMEKLEKNDFGQVVDEYGNYDPRAEFIHGPFVGEDGVHVGGEFGAFCTGDPIDEFGNVRVLNVFWKSRRRIMKVTSFDEVTGEEVVDFYPDGHKIDETMGEMAETFWVNEAWEGTKIGGDIYVNVRPCQVQYSRMTNPSACSFGIVGSIYNLNEGRPFSLVDMMKPYNYFYDVVRDRLNKTLARNLGKLIKFDIAKIPDGWDPDKWLYYAANYGIAVEDSFKEGNKGAATGKIAGALNNNTTGVIDAEVGQVIQGYITILEFINQEMSQVIGISPQREGSISNRETVGGVERATVQSAHITEWLFAQHDDVRKRALECFLETAKVALKGTSKKFEYLMSDNSIALVDIDGDEFAECDYGLVVDSSDGSQKLNQQMETLAQAGMQNGLLTFSQAMAMYGTDSLSWKRRMMLKAEREQQARQQQQAQQEQALVQQQHQAQMELLNAQQEFQLRLKEMENENRIQVAQIQAQSKWENTMIDKQDSGQFAAEMGEKQREWNEKMDLEYAKLKQKDESEKANRAVTMNEGSNDRRYDFSKTVMTESNKLNMAKQKAAEAKSKAKQTSNKGKQ